MYLNTQKRQIIGNKSPEILELLVTNYDKSNSEHRVALRRYLG